MLIVFFSNPGGWLNYITSNHIGAWRVISILNREVKN